MTDKPSGIWPFIQCIYFVEIYFLIEGEERLNSFFVLTHYYHKARKSQS